MHDLLAKPFADYALLDSGEGRKLERLAGVLVDRPSPQALWRRRLPSAEWEKATSVVVRSDDGGGFWRHRGPEPKDLALRWNDGVGNDLSFVLRLTAFGHCGVFFEQEPVWRRLAAAVRAQGVGLGRPLKALNLFGYTGAASLAMAAAGAEVFHVDSAKGVLAWGKDSAAASGFPRGQGQVRWVHEDAAAFLAHSRKKGFRYDLILADPPSWGHGAGKEVWRFDEGIQALAESCRAVLAEPGIFLLTSHTPGVQHRALANVAAAAGFPAVVSGELAQTHADDSRLLPAGIHAVGGVGLDAAAFIAVSDR